MGFKILKSEKEVAKLALKQGARKADPIYAEAIEAADSAEGRKNGVLFTCDGKKILTVRTALMKAARKLGVNISMTSLTDDSAVLIKRIPGKPTVAKRGTRPTASPAVSTAPVEPEEDDEEDEDAETDEEDDESDDEDEDEDDDEE